MLSFSINVLNFIWHGFHYPNSLPCRQSFIYIFLMLFICYRAYMFLGETPWKHVAAAFFGSVCFVLLAEQTVEDDAYHFIVFYAAILLLALGVFCRGRLFGRLEDTLIALLITLSLTLALRIFLAEYLLYRYDYDERSEGE